MVTYVNLLSFVCVMHVIYLIVCWLNFALKCFSSALQYMTSDAIYASSSRILLFLIDFIEAL